MKTSIGGIVLIMVLSLLVAADTSTASQDLGSTLQTLAEKYHLPGVVGAIIHGDRLVALGGTGVRKVGAPERFLSTDQIHLGSDTKAMTAILIGQLIDEKRLGFDTTVRQVFPDLAAKMNPAMARVTVRDLLDHDAGFPHDLDWGALKATGLSLPAQRRRAVEQALSVPPATPIGSFSYSNVSFVVLGAIVEAKTGKSWEEVIQKRLFGPLHMDSAGFGPPGTLGKVDEPWGHVLKDGKVEPNQTDNAPVLGPAGTVHCSISDWSKFIAETLLASEGHSTLISAETFKEMTTPRANQTYAGGWMMTQRGWAGGLALTHAGSNTTWYCNVWIAPNKNFAVLIATNYGSDPVAKAMDEGVGELIKFNSQMSGGR
jgi:CubicO group peptidase (beta-lactamase class C family)